MSTATTTPAPALTARRPAGLAERIARSAATGRGAHLATEDFHDWLDGRRRANTFRVDKIPFDALDGWSFDEEDGNLVHRSGRFFTVEGLHVVEEDGPYGDGPYRSWYQPVIKQPEVGILGILAKEFDGVLHFLMQAKMEPGNPNLLQLSPTVQATRSNYTKAHRGGDVKYIEYFTGAEHGTVIADSLQSEHGAWFFHKSNRNMIVEATGEVPLLDDFCWLTLGQLGELLHQDNVINMDARTVLSCVPYEDADAGRALLSDVQLLSWFTGERSRHDVRARRVPLRELPGWKQGEETIEHEEGRHFKVVAVSVQAGNREVTSWTQPLIEPVGLGVAAFLTRDFDGVPHYLVHARVEGGFLDTVELAPTVQYTPGNYAHLPTDERPPFLDLVLDTDPARVRYEAVHSEEGGRFLNAESRYLLVEADETQAPADPPPGYAWATAAQLTSLTRHGHYLNVQARTLLACVHAGAVRP
ncbi:MULTISPECIES: NDP-hexose 2,3-dehydratase family protein [Streptomyces]|uniref:2,3-dehydratase n=4 Tax=Streptomyces venezuelae TaxID=54571 RepID=F2RC29_STRVP|nr:NDP-hexose 2,3-dehydratase family protein [Streptomyces venezuelae]APE24782.1 NDP-hexose 2,3-dehydratase [Streptomyces venezuelae]QES02131.1 NDP-hexose 2,3-dehydratase [Streptomyces venezuelae ATCC 10712]CCA59280.1 2,3-dehydratase [Streptomyces venezuelae ATCC 10712]